MKEVLSLRSLTPASREGWGLPVPACPFPSQTLGSRPGSVHDADNGVGSSVSSSGALFLVSLLCQDSLRCEGKLQGHAESSHVPHTPFPQLCFRLPGAGLTLPWDMQSFSSLTRDRTYAPCIGSAVSTTGPPGKFSTTTSPPHQLLTSYKSMRHLSQLMSSY